ncbi:uracil-DNA glycosylase [Marisediminitalea aggregata]|uniref:Uracil-DNA glycosylase n=1 Tax=Marisediminitalea aggregata TaxID=634436 RepID=A0A1M5LR94_9ALTE|nr:uracil-DNA glycosylase [Marisediminitalea aggregata]SHG67644.1 uracil-DNA glycosylase [Marisediminitalea aggregata]
MPAWQEVLGPVKRADFFQQLMARIDAERAAGKAIYPPASEVFNAFTLTPLDNVKVVILGQDPYHGPGQAHGLCFSVQSGVKTPPSLVNIYKELAQDIEGFHVPEHGNLTAWAEQGVLLLNTVLTVEQGKAHSHAKWGWETFTDAVIKSVNDTQHGVVFLLWGSHAQKKGQNIDTQKHYVLNAPHPSPLSAHRGFLGCRHFSQTNTLLSQQGKTPVNWQV